MKSKFLDYLRLRTIEGCVGPSSLRNQGNKMVVARARSYLRQIDPERFVVRTEARFRSVLDQQTEALRRAFPPRAKNWGAARKTLNLFLRDVLYNRYLSSSLEFFRIESWLEVPLDSYVAEGLTKCSFEPIPKWRTIKHLSQGDSEAFQHAASHVAAAAGIARVHLDVYFWRNVAPVKQIVTTIKREFLREIIAGRKRVEYRKIKPYWTERFRDLKSPFILRLINGMSGKAPQVSVVVRKVVKNSSNGTYDLHLGRILEVKNWNRRREQPSAH